MTPPFRDPPFPHIKASLSRGLFEEPNVSVVRVSSTHYCKIKDNFWHDHRRLRRRLMDTTKYTTCGADPIIHSVVRGELLVANMPYEKYAVRCIRSPIERRKWGLGQWPPHMAYRHLDMFTMRIGESGSVRMHDIEGTPRRNRLGGAGKRHEREISNVSLGLRFRRSVARL